MDIAYVIEKSHFEVEEVDFPQLREITDNIILEFDINSYSTYFKRSLFESDRLGFNVGILINDDLSVPINAQLEVLLNHIRSFKVQLGVWVHSNDNTRRYEIYDFLKYYCINNFITGIKNTKEYNNYSWDSLGDIEYNSTIELHFLHKPIDTVILNTDMVKIYNENNLEPMISNYKIDI